MRRRRGLDREATAEIDLVAFILGDGQRSLVGDLAYATADETRRAWRRHRRDVWSATRRGSIPAAARVYDALSTAGVTALRLAHHHHPYPLDQVRAAIDDDRQAVHAFRRAASRGAAEVDHFLRIWLCDLGRAEAAAIAAARHTPYWTRPVPIVTTTATYGATVGALTRSRGPLICDPA